MASVESDRPGCSCKFLTAGGAWAVTETGERTSVGDACRDGRGELRCAHCGRLLAHEEPVAVSASDDADESNFEFAPGIAAATHPAWCALDVLGCDAQWVRTGRREAKLRAQCGRAAWIEGLFFPYDSAVLQIARGLAEQSGPPRRNAPSFYRRLVDATFHGCAQGHWGTLPDEEVIIPFEPPACASPAATKVFVLHCVADIPADAPAATALPREARVQQALTVLCRILAPKDFYATATLIAGARKDVPMVLRRNRSYAVELEVGRQSPQSWLAFCAAGEKTPFQVSIHAHGMAVEPDSATRFALAPTARSLRMTFQVKTGDSGEHLIHLDVVDDQERRRSIPLAVLVQP